LSYEDRSKEELINELAKLRKHSYELELYIKEKFPSDPAIYEPAELSVEKEGTRDNRIQLEAELMGTKLLQNISTELLYEDNIQALYEMIIDAAMQIMDSECASMQMLHNEEGKGGKLQLLVHRGFNPTAAKFWESIRVEFAGSACGEALRTGKRVIVINVEECGFMRDTEDLQVYLQTGIHAVQTTPLYSRSGKMLGMLSTHWRSCHQPSEWQLRLFDVLARQAADLIEQKQSKEKLRESEEKYRTLFEYMNEGFVLAEIIYDQSGKPTDYRYLAVNQALCDIIGLKREEIIGRTRSDIIMTPDTWLETFNKAALTGEPIILEELSEALGRHFLIRVFSPKRGQFACLVNDITENKKLEEKLKYQKELFESVVENMHDALVILNKKGQIEFRNAEARKGYHNINTQGKADSIYNGYEFFNMENNAIPGENLPIRRVFNGETIRNERMIIRGTGKDQYTEINATPIFDDENNLKSVVISHRDISKIIENEEEIKKHQEEVLRAEKEKRETIEAAMNVKDEFLYLITHEFKTPITVISSALQTIESVLKADITEKLGRYLNMIKMNTNRQLRLVNNLLDITRLNSGHIRINRRSVDIVYISKAIVNSVDVYAKQKRVNLNFISSIEKKEIYLDEEKFERIMLNLLSNALKFTPTGKNIEVFLSIKKRKDKNFISISVKDEGIGISKDKQKVIFERFGQADTSLSRQAEGTGLGLHLVNLLVSALEGEILLKSEPDKGSTFTVLLPAVKPISPVEEPDFHKNNRFRNGGEKTIQATYIEFSDIYFD
jgi:PAS domain S-box-containing protein